MCRSALTVAAMAVALASAAPALAGESDGWAINRGANAANVQVSVAPLPEGRGTAEGQPGCEQGAVGVTQYTFPNASGVTIYIGPGYSPYFSPHGYGAGFGVPYGYGYGSGSGTRPQVVVWASQGGGAY